ncbi:MATE family efflux transporter [Vibrio azureus]|uniref:Multidrug resistance protein NorM n=1 Tax=Vibrio azureus NBRC 104587 TaxID=1219077 RepID=U3AST4_9VIBR|nr:MATE family efflux transporter [Vibrio azureus]AUI87199.1 MATE family efflux transporter [Vibrio azureus]GAD76805.1 putative MatE family transporter [Vibrio azureus NBRC 104587]
MLEKKPSAHHCEDKHGLLTAPIASTLRKMTIPMSVGMCAILMFNLVDTFFISLLGTEALAAISYTFPVTFAVNSISMGIGTGLSANIARILGQGDTSQAARFTSHGLLLAVSLVSIVSITGFFAIEPLFNQLGAKEDSIPLIKQYMQVWFLTIPLLVIPIAGNSALRATGDTKTPAKLMILAGLLNGILDPLLIFGYGPFPQLGIQGAAIASAISWLGALCGSLYALLRRENMLAPPQLVFIKQDWLQTLKIGTPAAFSNIMNPLSGAVLMMLLSSYGTAAVAAYGAAQRIESILLLVLMSLTSSLTPFIAQNLGANNPQRAFEGWFLCMRFIILFQAGIFLAMITLSGPVTTLFSQDVAVKGLLNHYLLAVPLSYGFQGIVMMLVSGLNAMHKPLRAFQWSFMRLFIFNLPSAWVGSQLYGIEGLFIGIAVGNVLGGVCAYLFVVRERRLTLEAHYQTSSSSSL